MRGHSNDKNAFSRGGVVSVGKNDDTKIRVTIDTSKMHDKWRKCKSSKKYEKKASKKGENRPIFKKF